MNFLLLCIQSTVCCACVAFVKKLGVISFRDFDVQDAKHWFPISFLLVSVIYTGSKSLVSSARLSTSLHTVEHPCSNISVFPSTRYSKISPLYLLYAPRQPHDCPYLSLRQAYGEVLWFGGRVTGLTLVSFFFMVRRRVTLLVFGGINPRT